MKLSSILFIVFTGFCIRGFSQSPVHEVILFSTNDPHGQLDNFSRMAAYVKEQKKINKDIFVFNAGDLVNGNPVVDEAADKGSPMVDLMNSIPYDVSVPGNHEYENGEANLQRRVSQSTSCYLAANLQINPGSALKVLKPYCILHTSDGTSIAVLGLTTSSSNPCLVKNVNVADPIKTALRYQWLKKQNQVFVALTHIGYKKDSLLATELKDLDVIIGGHSHTELPGGLKVNGVLITQTGSHLKYLGKTVLKIKDHKVIAKTFELIPFSQMTETDSAAAVKIRRYDNENSFNMPVGTIAKDFESKEQLGAMKTDAIAEGLHLEMAFDDVRNVTLSKFSKGTLRLGDVYRLDPFDYKIIRYKLTPADIQEMILKSLKNKPENPALFVSGLNYTIKVSERGKAASVVLKDKNGAFLDPKRHYLVGVNSYIACHFITGNIKGSETGQTAASLLIKFLRVHKNVDYSHTQRIFVN